MPCDFAKLLRLLQRSAAMLPERAQPFGSFGALEKSP
jgi:hypothetical protein